MSRKKKQDEVDRILKAKITPEAVEKALKRRYSNVYLKGSTVVIVTKKGHFTIPVRASRDPMYGLPSYKIWQHVVLQRLKSGRRERSKILLSIVYATSATDLANKISEVISKYAVPKGKVENFTGGRAKVVDLLNKTNKR